jgi:hypothetical protein
MEIDGLPLHQLVNDSAVALVPLSVLLAWVFALLGSWRWLSRWATLLTTVAGLASVLGAVRTGRALFDERFAALPPDQPLYETLQTHQDRANLLLWTYVAFAVVVVLAFFLVPAPSGLRSGRLAFRGSPASWVTVALPGLLVILGGTCLVGAVLTGHAGAEAAFGS